MKKGEYFFKIPMGAGVMDKDILLAVAELWKLGLVIVFGGGIFIYRREIRALIAKFREVRVKNGGTEVVFCEGDSKKPIESESDAGVVNNTIPEDETIQLNNSDSEIINENGFWDAYYKKDLAGVKTEYEKMQDVETNGSRRLQNEAIFYLLCFRLGEQSGIDKLKDMLDSTYGTEAYTLVVAYLGSCYETGNAFDKALDVYNFALGKVNTDIDKAKLLKDKADCLFKMGMEYRIEAYNILKQSLNEVEDIEAKFTLYRGLANLYKQDENRLAQALTLEKALEIHPEDTDIRFEIAYAYGETDFKDLSLMHYKILLRFKANHNNGLNNIGVAYNGFDIPIRGVDYYKKAKDENNTLASSNLAYKLMDAGFSDEAKAILDEAMKQDEPHKNVSEALTQLNRRREAEVKKEDSIIALATQKQRYFLQYALKYILKKSEISLGGNWLTDGGIETTFILGKSNTFEAVWDEDGEKYKLNGTITNETAIITLTHVAKTLLIGKAPLDGIAYLDDLGRNLQLILFAHDSLKVRVFKRPENVSQNIEAENSASA